MSVNAMSKEAMRDIDNSEYRYLIFIVTDGEARIDRTSQGGDFEKLIEDIPNDAQRIIVWKPTYKRPIVIHWYRNGADDPGDYSSYCDAAKALHLMAVYGVDSNYRGAITGDNPEEANSARSLEKIIDENP